jgi:hypothetical protein
MPKANKNGTFAEVLKSSVTHFEAQLLNAETNNQNMEFGDFVKVNNDKITVFAIIENIHTQSIDNVHKPVAFGLSRDELLSEQPQILNLLKTHISCLVLAFQNDKNIFTHLPPSPVRIHDSVMACTQDEIIRLTENFEYLSPIHQQAGILRTELIAAVIRKAAKVRKNDYDYLVKSGQAASNLFRDDYDSLLSLLTKIKPDN